MKLSSSLPIFSLLLVKNYFNPILAQRTMTTLAGVYSMIKTRTETIGNLTSFVKEFFRDNHPYEVCEVISLPINDGNEPYLNWIGSIVPSSKK
ncbi:Similar to cuta: Protein CutA homolog (Xenopus laevis) [Cotesia congregata]|uniref:Similar to cuta: Protein CutA homolog (Xenopus laevis) n=1 Tax=Cotesia congregata TaxID=51543 RepID=A0A8J2HAP8_COTCN|nr:Similar to cuta: Protein CutA homolog (Xenopus laevis) [Cotesia congregata]